MHVIEKAETTDVAAILPLMDEYIGPIYQPSYVAWREKLVRDLGSGQKTALIAWDNRNIAGVAVYQRASRDFELQDTIEIKSLVVSSDYRRRGVGKRLLGKCHYEIQRMGYQSVVIECRHDQPIVPWLLGKGYIVDGSHKDYGWLSYRLSIELPCVYTDDPEDEGTMALWIAARLGIESPQRIATRRNTMVQGLLHIGDGKMATSVLARVGFCSNADSVKSNVLEDKGKCLPFYVLTRDYEQPGYRDLEERVRAANGTLWSLAQLNHILGVASPACSHDGQSSYCLAVLVYPSIFERLASSFTDFDFRYVVSGWVGVLLTEVSRVIFVSNGDSRFLGTANYLGRQLCSSAEDAWVSAEEKLAFDEREFGRWAHMKKHLTLLSMRGLKRFKAGFMGGIDRSVIEQNKWCYLSYDEFMDLIEGDVYA